MTRIRTICCRVLLIGAGAGMFVLPTGSLGAAPPVATPPGQPPSDAVVIFDGHGTDALVSRDGKTCPWPVEDGVLVVRPFSGGLWTKATFRDAQVHAEFATPKKGPGNSGLYFHGQFEMQIYNSYGSREVDNHSIGAVYGIAPPLVNAARPAGQWQTYDIVFISPRLDKEGNVTRPGSLTALLNGVLVQNHTEIRRPVSPYAPMPKPKNPYVAALRAELLKSGKAPLLLQDHETDVRFRNIWLRRLDRDQ